MTQARITVYIAGVTGWTGTSIADALLERPEQYKVIAPVRPSSVDKPAVASLRARGAEIHIVDISALGHQGLVDELRGVQIVVSTLTAFEIELQKALAKASKDAGVVRFVPSDWATACIPGVMQLHDLKLSTQEYIKELGLGYTFIDVGGWSESAMAFVSTDGMPYAELAKVTTAHWGTGDVKTALTDRSDVGQYVARILADERTLNRYVFIWAEEITLNEIIALAEKATGKKLEFPHISSEELEERIKSAEGLLVYALQYMQSLWIRGDNTVANAKRPEYGSALDAQELYPDYTPRRLDQLIDEFAARVRKN